MLFASALAPQFHASYGESELVVGISPVRIIQGDAPAQVRLQVLEWARQHQRELMTAWRRCQARQTLLPIAPLQ